MPLYAADFELRQRMPANEFDIHNTTDVVRHILLYPTLPALPGVQ